MKSITISLLALGALAYAMPTSGNSQETARRAETAEYHLNCGSETYTEWCADHYDAGCDADGTFHTGNVFYCASSHCKCEL